MVLHFWRPVGAVATRRGASLSTLPTQMSLRRRFERCSMFSTLGNDGRLSIVAQEAPDFEAETLMPNGTISKLQMKKELAGHQGVCLMFYPLNFTFVCPSEIIAYNSQVDEFKKRDWLLWGVSVDSVYCHSAWCNIRPPDGGVGRLRFPLVSDLDKSISRSYGVLFNGSVALRSSVLIDKSGKVRHATINDLPLGRSVDETLRIIDMIEHVNSHGDVCPANWRSGADAMVPSSDGVKVYMKKHYK